MMSEQNNPRTKYNLPTFNSIVQEIGYDLESYTQPLIEKAVGGKCKYVVFNKYYFFNDGTFQYKADGGTYPKYLWPKVLKLAQMLIENAEVENALYE
jgi:hypothetical protein